MFNFKPTRIFYDGDGGGDPGTGDPGTGDPGTGDPGAGTKLPDGAFMADDFRGALPEDIRDHSSLANIKNVGDLGRSFVNAQQMIGKDPSRVIELPTADKPDELKAVMVKLGAPADASGYKLVAAEGLPEHLGPDKELSQGFLKFAASEGMLPVHVQNTYAWMTGVLAEASKTQEAQVAATAETHIRELEAEFGPAFDQRIAKVNHAIDKVGGEDLRKVLNDAGIGANPVIIKSYLQVASLMSEDNAGDGGGAGDFGNRLSPDEARSKGKALLIQAHQSSDMAERRRLNEEAQKFFHMAAPGDVPSTL